MVVMQQVYVIDNIVGIFQRNLDAKGGVLSPEATPGPTQKKKKGAKGSVAVELEHVVSNAGAEEAKESQAVENPSSNIEVVDLTGESSFILLKLHWIAGKCNKYMVNGHETCRI